MKINKILRRAFSAFFLLVGTIAAFSQNTKEERIVLERALTTIENYGILSTVSDEEAYYSFLDLFESKDAVIFNDLLGNGRKLSVSVQEYADFQQNQAKSKQAAISNINLQNLLKEDGKWRIEYTFEKSISYLNKNKVYYSSLDFYGQPYKMKAVLVCSADGKCKIESLTGSLPGENRLEENHYIFVRTSPYDDDLTINGQKVSTNRFNQQFLSASIDASSFRFADADVLAKPAIDTDTRIITMQYRARRNALKLHYDMWFGNPYKLGSAVATFDNSSSANSFGLDYGYIFPSKSKLKIGLFAGAGLTISKINMLYTNADYVSTVGGGCDVDGDTYLRHYKDLSVSQRLNLTDFNIPIYADLDYRFSRIVSAYADLGFSANLMMAKSMSLTDGSAYVYGIYPQYNNLYMDEHWGINGFGNRTFSASQLDENTYQGFSTFTLDLIAGAGFRVNIPRTPLALNLGLSYQMGLLKIMEREASAIAYSSGVNEGNALVYNQIVGVNSTDHVRNISDSFSEIMRSGLKLNIGIIFKF